MDSPNTHTYTLTLVRSLFWSLFCSLFIHSRSLARSQFFKVICMYKCYTHCTLGCSLKCLHILSNHVMNQSMCQPHVHSMKTLPIQQEPCKPLVVLFCEFTLKVNITRLSFMSNEKTITEKICFCNFIFTVNVSQSCSAFEIQRVYVGARKTVATQGEWPS